MQKEPVPLNFDYLRLFLAATVFTGHTGFPLMQVAPLWSNEIAVLGFFCISGYLIAQSFMSDPDIGSYAIKRAARIYPPIAALVLVLLTFGWLADYGQGYMRGVFSLLLFQDWLVLSSEGAKLGVFGHGAFWSLVIEFQFYMFLPVAIICWGKRPVVTVLALIAILFAAHFSRRYLGGGVEFLAFRDNLFTVAHFFIAGMLAAMYARNVTREPWFWFPILPVSALLYLVLQFRGDEYLTHLMPFVLVILALAIARISAIVSAAISTRYTTRAPWGDLSYGLYLYHFPVLFLVRATEAYIPIPMHTNFKTLFGTILISFLSWHLMERPINDWAKRSTRRVSQLKGDVGAGAQEGGEIHERPAVRSEDINRIGALNDAAKAGGNA